MTTTTHRILVSGTFTTEPLLAPLAFLADRLGVPVSAEVRGYGQVHQQLLAPASDFAQNQSGLNVALVRWDDLVSGGDGDLQVDGAALAGQQVVTQNLKTRLDDSSKVDVDQELAHLVTLQNAYAANARVMQVVRELFDILMRS